MIGPKRLLEGEGTDVERMLLSAGRAARPRARAKWKAAFVFALMSIGAVSKARAAILLGAKARAWAVAQWLAIGAVGTGAAGYAVIHARTEAPRDQSAVVRSAPSHRTKGTAVSPRDLAPKAPDPAAEENAAIAEALTPVLPSMPTRPSPEPQATPRPKRVAVGSTALVGNEPSAAARSIAAEVQELERARQALAAGEAKRAIERLDRYDRLYPRGAMQQEGMRLRIEALTESGERASARLLAQRFRALYPDSTHSERLKSLVREP